MSGIDINLVKSDEDRILYSSKFDIYSVLNRFHFNVNFNENLQIDLQSVILKIQEKVNEVFQKVKNHRKLKDTDKIRLAFNNNSLGFEISIAFIDVGAFNAEMLSNLFHSVEQSKKDFLINNNKFEIDITSVNLPEVGGKRKRGYCVSFQEYLKTSTKVVQIKDDGKCLIRAFVVSKAHADYMAQAINKNDYRRYREDTYSVQTIAVNDIIRELKLENQTSLNPHIVLPLLQKLYNNKYQIVCVTYPYKVIYNGPDGGTQIYIVIKDGHADSLLSMTSLLQTSYFCTKCLIGHNDYNKHKCNEICKYCQSFPVCEFDEKIQCKKCNLSFVSPNCYENHLNITKICGNRLKCLKCEKIYTAGKHLCGQRFCKHCKEFVPILNHLCYQKPLNKEKLIEQDDKWRIFLFYDFECMVECEKNGFQYHKPNLCVTQLVCTQCWDSANRDKTNLFCSYCKGEQKIFSGVNTVGDFLEYLFVTYQKHLKEAQKKFKLDHMIEIIAIAHNSRAYDSIFIIKY